MSGPFRAVRSALVPCVCAIAVAGCHGGAMVPTDDASTGSEDVPTQMRRETGPNPTEASVGVDGAMVVDGTGGGDAGAGNTDAATVDGLAITACVPISVPVRIVDEPSLIERPLDLVADQASFAAIASFQRSSQTNAYLTQFDVGANAIRQTDVSFERNGSVSGGGVAWDAPGYTVVYTSNRPDPGFATGYADVFLQHLPANPMGFDNTLLPPIRITDDEPYSEEPQVAKLGTGWVVVWRQRPDFPDPITHSLQQTLQSVFVSASGMLGSITQVAPPTGNLTESPGSFQLVGDGATVALAYVGSSTDAVGDAGRRSYSDVYVQELGTDGSATGDRIALTQHATVSDTLGATLRGATRKVAVTWIENVNFAPLHVGFADLVAHAPSEVNALAAAGTSADAPGIAPFGSDGFIVGFRRVVSTLPTISAIRLDRNLQAAAAPAIIAQLPDMPGGAVRIAARPDASQVAFGWTQYGNGSSITLVSIQNCSQR